MSSESRDEAIREAKRYVRDVVRNDWSFEFSAKPGAPPPTYPANPEPTEVLEWRLREYDSSGSELEPQSSPPPASPFHDTGDTSGSSSVSSSAGTRRTERRRKRRRQMEEEMSWNEGLRTWVERRDAWSGARSNAQVRSWEQRQQSSEGTEEDGQGQQAMAGRHSGSTEVLDANADANSLPASATPRPIAVPATGESSNLASKTETLNLDDENNNTMPAQQSLRDGENELQPPTSPPPVETNNISAEPDSIETSQPLSTAALLADIPSPSATTTTTTTSTSTNSPSSDPTSLDPFHDPLIPVVPSLIATTNPIRASITPAMYPSIYSKVVLQGLTPTVPINLADLTRAMVQGWKADGQWPPTPKPQTIVLPDINAAVARRSRQPDTPSIQAAAEKDKEKEAAAAPPGERSPESKKKGGIASTVRKVLHFSGFHPHPFHRRGSSSHQQVQSGEIEGVATGPGGGEGGSRPEVVDK
ncbi:hypothetical protein BJX61DRAFT_320428 [Aspergillus egyptiacus]|nr:hypothetical protein BJX61DRAFT_320428 [Aspergillus egyptiacus]